MDVQNTNKNKYGVIMVIGNNLVFSNDVSKTNHIIFGSIPSLLHLAVVFGLPR